MLWLFVLAWLVAAANAIKITRHSSAQRQEKLLSLHADPVSFVDATWIIHINRANEGNGVSIDGLKHHLSDDHCELLDSAISDTEFMFKIYCNATSKAATHITNNNEDNNNAKLGETLLKNTFLQYLYRVYDASHIILEQNKLMRKPSHFYYGTNEILDYAIRHDSGQNDPAIPEIKMPSQAVYDRIQQQDFVESSAPWALDRIDQRTGSLDGVYQYIDTGSDIDIYVVDSGVRITHQEFQGRATFLINTVGDGIDTDCVGHGTFVASEIAGVTFGVAKMAHVYAVKVLDCSGDGDLFTIQAGIMQVIETASTNTTRRGVVNLSLGGAKSTLLDNAVLTLISNNIVVSVSAGNSGADACNYSPADLGGTPSAEVLTVAASDINDDRPSWSNTGSCVSISAPGNNVVGAWYTSDVATTVLSGTSMAAPLVAGTAALILEQDLILSVADVKALIIAWATPSIIDFTTSGGGGKNLLFSLVVPSAEPPPTSEPAPLATSAPHHFPPPPPDFIESDASRVVGTLLILLPIILFLSI